MPKRITVFLCCLAIFCCGCRRFRAQPVSKLKMRETIHENRLLRGFYQIQDGWRWTARVFAVSLDPLRTSAATYLELDCGVPQEVMTKGQTATLIATVNGIEVGRQTFYAEGRYKFTRYVPVAALQRAPAEVQFEMDRSAKDAGNGRQLGLIAVSIALKEYEQTAEYHDVQTWLAREGLKDAASKREAAIPPAKELELRKLFEGLSVWENLKFQNVPIGKNPLDVWMIQQIVSETRPDFIIETGTSHGGSALYWANTPHGMGLENSRVLTVDRVNLTREASPHFLWKKYVEFLQSDSTDPALISRIAQRVRGRTTVVILDSDHAADQCLRN